eukprot:TRINITY_DN18713_c0_g1_i1.p1 TRINITY_DN18713_c0_g1~~TRINITY_DN18713_c0_g1_i1.p1  ORF type:complete len:455 (+),score=170.54 TRINITY_DN18713_c0_g1_i1:61-1425(+)
MNLHDLQEVKELYAQEQAIMGCLKMCTDEKDRLRRGLGEGLDRSEVLLDKAERGVARAIKKEQKQSWPEWLDMPNPDLCNPTPPEDIFAGLRGLKSQLQIIDREMNAVWPASFTSLLERTIRQATDVDANMPPIDVLPNPNIGIALLPQQILVRLEQLATLGSKLDISTAQETIRSIRAQLTDLCNAETHQMDVKTASNLGLTKIKLQTSLIEAVRSIIRTIEAAEDEAAALADLTDAKNQALQQTAALKEPRWRLNVQCTSALRGVRSAMSIVDKADREAEAMHQANMSRSKAKMKQNVKRQNEIWSQINSLYEELGALTLERSGEVQYQMEEGEKEFRRKEEYKWGQHVAGEHIRMLEQNQQYCEGAIKALEITDELIVQGSDMASQFQTATLHDLASHKMALFAEEEAELATLQHWTTEHRQFIKDMMHKAHVTGTPISPRWQTPLGIDHL